jgi:hypothetical protein
MWDRGLSAVCRTHFARLPPGGQTGRKVTYRRVASRRVLAWHLLQLILWRRMQRYVAATRIRRKRSTGTSERNCSRSASLVASFVIYGTGLTTETAPLYVDEKLFLP